MKTQGHKSIGRAISLDRFSASLVRRKRSTADMSSMQAGHTEGGLRDNPSIRTTTHRTSHTEFLNWVTYSRDLSPDTTDDQRRTCPVCEKAFRDRRSMLQHIPTCSKLVNGFYRCIYCNEREKIGRYHMNGCIEVHVYQNWLKRILSFRSSKILVDASESNTLEAVETEVTRAPWERVELPSESLIELDSTRCVLELDSTEARSSTAELDGDGPTFGSDYRLDAWGPVHDMPPWQGDFTPEYALNIYGGWGPIHEMPSWQPQELAGDGYDMSDVQQNSSDLHENCRAGCDPASPSSGGVNQTRPDYDHPIIVNESVIEHSNEAISARSEVLKPSLKLDTSNFARQSQYHPQEESYLPFCVDGTVQHAEENFHSDPRVQSESSISYTEFPSPPTSPIQQHEHDTPVSPIEYSPRSSSASSCSRFSSLSSLLMDDSSVSSFSSSDVIFKHDSSDIRVFEDREMCFEPEDMDSFATPPDGQLSTSYDHGETMYSETETSTSMLLPLLSAAQDTTVYGFDLDSTHMSVQADTTTIECFNTSFDSIELDRIMNELTETSARLSPDIPETELARTNMFDVGIFDTIFPQDTILTDSVSSSESSPATDNRQSSTPPSIESLSPEDDHGQSPRSEGRRSLTRSPAFRAVYKCTYGACSFEPTGKKAYHKRTLQRHQEKCFYSPLPREKKPCKCTFPGCNKGFSRSDGLNAHRKTTGHGVKIELQVMEGNDDTREAIGFL
ncbi:uncharacterized protein LY89DRAFT_666131 [Mollisia scopiformis]|uniref:C2H2-type domain-containing protein n=1 Tax=Mollisia scopiformis TaxID=149040 RepID=A0A194XJP6_MOLSC|nr:uncharacterized protein LY89DRAFT_666131 [Mollisia scopiformis]KUJ20460.1 hypothetical protein LY89DRAFT_666131 [Mollisia scopiformis]